MQDSERIFTNCHVSGVGLRSTVVASICSNLCLGKVHIVWQKTAESSLLPYSLFLAPAFQPESQATALLSTWGQYFLGSQIGPLLLFSFFSLHSWLETWGLSRNCARCVRQHSDMLGCNWCGCAVLGLSTCQTEADARAGSMSECVWMQEGECGGSVTDSSLEKR